MSQDQISNKISKDGNFIVKSPQNSVQIKIRELFSLEEKQTFCECIMILDNEINERILQICVFKCRHIILVDGGANRLYKSKFRDSQKIKCVIGDLDGISEQVRLYYKCKGIQLIKNQDQDTTDFQKSICYAQKQGFKEMVCINYYPGRLDHVLAAINYTQKYLERNPSNNIILIGNNSLMIYLHQSIEYRLSIDSDFIEKAGCGLITFGKVSHIQTQGFKWNLGQKEYFKSLEWGKFISTSNQLVKSQVRINSSHPVFFIAQLKSQ